MKNLSFILGWLALILILTACVCNNDAGRSSADAEYLQAIEATFLEFNDRGDLIGISSHNKFTDDSMKRLAGFQKLEYVSLLDAPITDSGLDALRNKLYINRLSLNGSQVTDK